MVTTVTFNMAHQSGMYFDFRVLMCSKSTTHRSRVVIVNITNCKSNIYNIRHALELSHLIKPKHIGSDYFGCSFFFIEVVKTYS